MMKSIIGNNPDAMIQQLSQSNATCTLPDGTRVPVSQVLQQCQGKSPAEAFQQFGLDYSQIQPLM